MHCAQLLCFCAAVSRISACLLCFCSLSLRERVGVRVDWAPSRLKPPSSPAPLPEKEGSSYAVVSMHCARLLRFCAAVSRISACLFRFCSLSLSLRERVGVRAGWAPSRLKPPSPPAPLPAGEGSSRAVVSMHSGLLRFCAVVSRISACLLRFCSLSLSLRERVGVGVRAGWAPSRLKSPSPPAPLPEGEGSSYAAVSMHCARLLRFCAAVSRISACLLRFCSLSLRERVGVRVGWAPSRLKSLSPPAPVPEGEGSR